MRKKANKQRIINCCCTSLTIKFYCRHNFRQIAVCLLYCSTVPAHVLTLRPRVDMDIQFYVDGMCTRASVARIGCAQTQSNGFVKTNIRRRRLSSGSIVIIPLRSIDNENMKNDFFDGEDTKLNNYK